MKDINMASSARAFGRLRLGKGVYIAQGTVVRSNSDSLKMDNSSWALENSVLIGNKEHPLAVGSKTVFGHRCIAIGAEIGNLCEIGNSCIFMPGSKVGDMCIFGEGTLIPEDFIVPEGSVVVGKPGRIIRKLTDADKAMIQRMRGGDTTIVPFEEHILDFADTLEPEEDRMKNLFEYKGKLPVIADSATIYDTAEITGDVVVGENTVIASGVKIIGNSHGPVRIGNNVQILENTVLHLLPDNQLLIKDHVTIGPGCMIHGTTIGENSIIEPGAIVCDYSHLGQNSLVKAGSLVKQRSRFEDNDIIKGYPAKKIGESRVPLERPLWAVRNQMR